MNEMTVLSFFMYKKAKDRNLPSRDAMMAFIIPAGIGAANVPMAFLFTDRWINRKVDERKETESAAAIKGAATGKDLQKSAVK